MVAFSGKITETDHEDTTFREMVKNHVQNTPGEKEVREDLRAPKRKRSVPAAKQNIVKVEKPPKIEINLDNNNIAKLDVNKVINHKIDKFID